MSTKKFRSFAIFIEHRINAFSLSILIPYRPTQLVKIIFRKKTKVDEFYIFLTNIYFQVELSPNILHLVLDNEKRQNIYVTLFNLVIRFTK